MDRNARIYVAGHRGLLGSALVRRLRSGGYSNLILRTRAELDLTDPRRVAEFLLLEKPEVVLLAAARGGGILANDNLPAQFIRDNLLIQTSVIHASMLCGARRLLFFGNACMYPRLCAQPMKEESLGTGPVDPTGEAFATAKLAGHAMCEAYNRQHQTEFATVIPATLYGPDDRFDRENGHVLSALLRRFHELRTEPEVVVWGSGAPVREFLYVDDLAEACVLLLQHPSALPPSPINVGSGAAVSVGRLAEMIRTVVGSRSRIVFDRLKPDGAPERVLDSSRVRSLGWSPRTTLEEGLRRTFQWYLNHN